MDTVGNLEYIREFFTVKFCPKNSGMSSLCKSFNP